MLPPLLVDEFCYLEVKIMKPASTDKAELEGTPVNIIELVTNFLKPKIANLPGQLPMVVKLGS